jgi:hypothetical protein
VKVMNINAIGTLFKEDGVRNGNSVNLIRNYKRVEKFKMFLDEKDLKSRFL